MTSKTHDVLVLGAGYTGSLAAMALARKGYRVALVDRGNHPRFAVGESTTPEQLYVLDWLGRELGIPELRRLSSYEYIKHDRLPIAVWPKEAFYFLFNPALFPGAPAEFLHQTHPWPAGPTYHCLRADLDWYVARTAVKYGAEFLPDSAIRELDLSGGAAAVRLDTPDGPKEIRARLLIDATGPGCFLAEKLGLREEGRPLGGLRSWSVYSHFTGVRGLESTFGRGWPRQAIPRDNTTFHHVSPDGWAWVIPFDNGITSVGVVFRAGDESEAARDPRGVFDRYVRANPAFAAMMEGAARVRDFTYTGPLQWRARKIAGPGWVVLPPASGFSDPFFSPGNMLSTTAVARLSLAIDGVLREGRAAAEAFAWLQSRHELESAHVARVINAHFLAFRDPLLFEQAQALYWLALALDRAGGWTPRDGGPALMPPQWAAGDEAFNALTAEFERLLEEGASEAPASLAPRLAALLRRGDRFELLPSAPRRTRLTTLSHASLLRRLRRQSGAPGPAGPIQPLESLGHLLRVLSEAPLTPRVPASAGALRMFARHLRIALLGT